jgi:peptide/nickel transport system substrate-binding protein
MTLVLLSACAPSGDAKPAAAPQSGAQTPAPRTQKILTVANQVEPSSLVPQITGGPAGGGGTEVPYIVHDNLTVEVELEQYAPQLAAELPSVDKNTWRLNPDGTMDTIWKLRPNVYWHDGTPFTSDDLAFTFTLVRDPQMGVPTATTRLMDSVEAPDPTTFIIHWNSVFAQADTIGTFAAILPRHLLGEAYQAGRDRLLSSRYFTSEFVGLGPYKVVDWQAGSHLTVTRFDQYYQGRPPLDGLIVRFMSDPNAMVAAILAGSVDVVMTGISVEAAVEVKRRWEGTANQVVIEPAGKVYVAEVQYRPEFVQPKATFDNRNVRQAFYQAIDRMTVADTMTQGLGPAADSYFYPSEAIRPAVERFIPQYPYDPNRAQELLAQAGWVRGSDGVLARQGTGERFQTGIWGHPDDTRTRLVTILANYWKNVGVDVTVNQIPPERISDQEYGATIPGWWIVNPSSRVFYLPPNTIHTRQIPSAATRWNGQNYGGYSNPKADDLQDRLNATINPTERTAIQQQLVQELMGDVAVLPLYWIVTPTLMRAGVTGPKPLRSYPTLTIFKWDML